MIANGNTYCKIASFGPILPTEYQEVEYIESTGTQYIDTNTTIKNETIYDIKAQITQLQETAPSGGENFFIGTMSANNTQYTLRCLVYGNNIIIQRGQFSVTGVVSIQKDTNWHTYYSSKTLCKIDNTTGVPSYTITDSNLKIFLFKQNRDGYANQNSYCRIAYCKIWDDSILVRNFIPCYRKSDNEIGMYDTVNKVFYTNQGTGTFLKGNNVVHTIKYKIPTEERPYISGHVTDGSSTFTFTVNGNESITVPVDSSGNWKWVVDRTITSLSNMFYMITNLQSVELYGIKGFTSAVSVFDKTNGNDTTLINVRFKNCDFLYCTNEQNIFKGRKNLVNVIGYTDSSHVLNTNLGGIFWDCRNVDLSTLNYNNLINQNIKNLYSAFCYVGNGTENGVEYVDLHLCKSCTNIDQIFYASFIKNVYLPDINSDTTIGTWITSATKIFHIDVDKIAQSMTFKYLNQLDKQSVLNIINAAAANVTYTLHSTIYNKCASSGEWYSDIQAAIDAKAQQGYTVTLISA